MTPPTTYLAPGQRYAHAGAPGRPLHVTIVRLQSDALGLPQVLFAYPGGRQVIVAVSHVEAAIAGGQLAPVAGPGCVGRC